MSTPTPAIVLVHGAWADASGWSAVILRLQEDGFTVYAPPNPLRGLPQDAAYLRAFLTQNPALAGQPVIVAGHSYGGAVITNAAAGDPQVKALVYVDAFIPDEDETIGQLAGPSPGHACWETAPRSSTGSRPGCGDRRRGSVHQAGPGPRLLRQRADRPPGRGRRRHPAAASGQRLRRTVGIPGLADDPVVGRRRHRGPGHPARRADVHGQAGRCPHHRGGRWAPVDDLRPRDRRPGHPAGGQSVTRAMLAIRVRQQRPGITRAS